MNAPSEAGTEKEQSSTLKSRPNGTRERARRGDAGGGGPSRGARAAAPRGSVWGVSSESRCFAGGRDIHLRRPPRAPLARDATRSRPRRSPRAPLARVVLVLVLVLVEVLEAAPSNPALARLRRGTGQSVLAPVTRQHVAHEVGRRRRVRRRPPRAVVAAPEEVDDAGASQAPGASRARTRR